MVHPSGSTGEPMPMSIAEIAEKVYTNVSTQLIEQNDGFPMPPIAMIFKGEGAGTIPTEALAMAGQYWPEALTAIIKSAHEQLKIDAYMVCAMSFGVMSPSARAIQQINDGVSPSEIEGSEEVLAITVGDQMQTLNKLWNVIRDPESRKVVKLTPKPVPDDFDVIGTLSDLLIERPKYLN